MEKRYEVYSLADRYFYETLDRQPSATESSPGSGANGTARLYPAALRDVPAGWRSARSGDWLHLDPEDRTSPAQGWKIHVSACLGNAERTVDTVWDYCVPRSLPFKFVPG